MNELGLFTLALGLTEPWRVSDLKFSKEEGRLDLWIDFVKGAKFPCPACEATKEGEVHDTQDRTWRHLNFFQYETYLHARVPRVRCGSCGIKQVEVPWARPGSGFTLLFELLIVSLAREMSVAELVSEHANRLWRILDHYVERARQAVDLSGLPQLGIDEFSLRKGHVYMTSFGDLEASRVVFLGEGRKRGVIEDFIRDLESRGVDSGQIEIICCDMWDPYLSGIGESLKRARVVFDRFHVMNQLNKAIERVRWDEQRENKALKKSRFLWLKNPENLTPKQEARLQALKRLDLKTARAYQIKLALARFWEIANPAEAMSYLKRWYFWAT